MIVSSFGIVVLRCSRIYFSMDLASCAMLLSAAAWAAWRGNRSADSCTHLTDGRQSRSGGDNSSHHGRSLQRFSLDRLLLHP